MMNEREYWVIKRRKYRIRLKNIAQYVNCSISLISRWETNSCDMSDEKLFKYKEYILKHTGGG